MALTATEARIAKAIGQTLFQRDKVLPIDALDAGVVDYLDDFFGRLPRAQRLQMAALFRGIDAGYKVWARDPLAQFTRADVADRLAYLESWEQSDLYLRRMAFMGLKVVFNMAYIDSEPVRQATGIKLRTAGPAPVLGADPATA